jgi:hypothetical protein
MAYAPSWPGSASTPWLPVPPGITRSLALELTAPLCPLQHRRRQARKLTILAGLPSTTASTCSAQTASAAAFSVRYAALL